MLRRHPTSSFKDIVHRNSNEYLVLMAATYHSLKILSVDPLCTDLALPLHLLRVTVLRASISSRLIVWLLLRVLVTDRIVRTGCILPLPPVLHRRRRSARVSLDQEAPPPITFLRNRSHKIFRVTFLHRICRPPSPRCTIISISSNSSNNISNLHLCNSNNSILVV